MKDIRGSIVSVFNAKGPPVPIPNTEVKLCCGENTCLATDRENSSMPTHNKKDELNSSFFVVIRNGADLLTVDQPFDLMG